MRGWLPAKKLLSSNRGKPANTFFPPGGVSGGGIELLLSVAERYGRKKVGLYCLIASKAGGAAYRWNGF